MQGSQRHTAQQALNRKIDEHDEGLRLLADYTREAAASKSAKDIERAMQQVQLVLDLSNDIIAAVTALQEGGDTSYYELCLQDARISIQHARTMILANQKGLLWRA